MYSVADYGSMIADRVRMDAYTRVLQSAVKPGAVVLDIGTGTGIFALLACRFGARRVYAIEPNDAIQVAREIARANGYADRIEFLQMLSTCAVLPEKADVIVSDLRGWLPLCEHHIPSIADARRRFLAPGGKLIPQCDTLWAAGVEAPQLYRDLVGLWDETGFDFDMEGARRLATNTTCKGRVVPDQLLLEPQSWATLDYATVESPGLRGTLTWTATRAGTVHGLVVWFDSTLADGVQLSNAPDKPPLIYGRAFFPWTEPALLAIGDTVCVALQADLVGADYVWRWDTCVRGGGAARPLKAHFEQSTFSGAPLSAKQLRKHAADYVPVLDEEGQIDRFLLAQMDDQTSQEAIARRAAERFPARFTQWEAALTRVAELSQKYSRS